jgi:hypothetical protein
LQDLVDHIHTPGAVTAMAETHYPGAPYAMRAARNGTAVASVAICG